MRNHLVATLLSSLFVLPAHAKDLGVQGNTWPIVEIDFRQLMLESAAKVDMNKVQDDLKASTERFFDNLPRRILPSAEKTTTRYIDPSITLTSDIQAPVANASGDYQWTTLYAKGTKVNPLEKFRPLTAMLYFDGTSEEQLKFVREALAANPMRIVPVETAGANVKTLSKSFNRPIFFANDGMMARFRVTQLPALLYPGSGEYANYLGLTAFAAPYKVSELEAVWPSTPPQSKAGGPNVAPVPQPVTDQEKAALGSLLNPAFKGVPNENKK